MGELPKEKARSSAQRFDTVDSLRGLAALAVCIFHMTKASVADFLPVNDPLRVVGAIGEHGVEVFFVISGFVVPWSLYAAGFVLVSWPRFVARRLVRLDPPYIATIVLTLGLNWASSRLPGYAGPPFRVDAPQLLAHLGYVNVLLGYDWLQPVFWTLAIEFQYYLGIGLLFPLLNHRASAVRWASVGLMGVLAFLVPGRQFATAWAWLFLCGVLTFQYRVGLMKTRTYLVALSVALFGVLGTLGLPAFLAASLAAPCIAFLQMRGRLLAFLARISYSLYLIHSPIGGRVINLSLRFNVPPEARILVVLAAVSASILGAWVLWRLIEQPAQKLAARIRYRPRLPSGSHRATA